MDEHAWYATTLPKEGVVKLLGVCQTVDKNYCFSIISLYLASYYDNLFIYLEGRCVLLFLNYKCLFVNFLYFFFSTSGSSLNMKNRSFCDTAISNSSSIFNLLIRNMYLDVLTLFYGFWILSNCYVLSPAPNLSKIFLFGVSITR